jgi:nucleotidyltransferase/DNA polymerase involved in DNA repair
MEDLKKVGGIGPAHEASLHNLNIKTIAELAAITEPGKFVDAAVFKADDLAGWIEQAKQLVEADKSNAGAQTEAPPQAAPQSGDKPRRSRKSKKDEVATMATDTADELRRDGKARRATIDDFRRAGKIKA